MKYTITFLSILAIMSYGESKKQTSTWREDNKKVYVCTGNYATKYHKDKSCKGLARCKSKTISVTIQKAESMGKTPCGYCY